MATTFEEFVAKERERLIKARDDAHEKRKAAEEELLAIEREIAAIAAYEQVKTGKPLQAEAAPTPRASSVQRGRRGEKRTEILELIKGNAEGYTRGELIEKMNATDKSAQQSISNALSALFKANELKKEGKKYVVG